MKHGQVVLYVLCVLVFLANMVCGILTGNGSQAIGWFLAALFFILFQMIYKELHEEKRK